MEYSSNVTNTCHSQALYELVHVRPLNPANDLLVCYSYFTDEETNLKSVTLANVS